MFLPAISRLFAALLLVFAAACQRQVAAVPPTSAELLAYVDVVAGTGEVSAADVQEVREAVAVGLPRLQGLFQKPLQHRFHVFVHADREHMPDALVASLHSGTAGFAMLGAHQVHIVRDEVANSGSNLRAIVAHELVHELLDQYAGEFGRRIPRWFHEGLAQVLGGDSQLHAREEELVLRLLNQSHLPFEGLKHDFPKATAALRAAYAQSHSYVAWLHERYGLPALLRMVAAVDRDITFEGALVGTTRRNTLELQEAWRQSVLHSGAPWRLLFSSCFDLLMVAILPLLVLALRQRLKSESRAARRMAEREAAEQVAMAQRAEALRLSRLAAEQQLLATELVHEDAGGGHGGGSAAGVEPRPSAAAGESPSSPPPSSR